MTSQRLALLRGKWLATTLALRRLRARQLFLDLQEFVGSFGLMMQDRLFNFVSAIGLVIAAAAWLWFLFAYADWIFSR